MKKIIDNFSVIYKSKWFFISVIFFISLILILILNIDGHLYPKFNKKNEESDQEMVQERVARFKKEMMQKEANKKIRDQEARVKAESLVIKGIHLGMNPSEINGKSVIKKSEKVEYFDNRLIEVTISGKAFFPDDKDFDPYGVDFNTFVDKFISTYNISFYFKDIISANFKNKNIVNDRNYFGKVYHDGCIRGGKEIYLNVIQSNTGDILYCSDISSGLDLSIRKNSFDVHLKRFLMSSEIKQAKEEEENKNIESAKNAKFD